MSTTLRRYANSLAHGSTLQRLESVTRGQAPAGADTGVFLVGGLPVLPAFPVAAGGPGNQDSGTAVTGPGKVIAGPGTPAQTRADTMRGPGDLVQSPGVTRTAATPMCGLPPLQAVPTPAAQALSNPAWIDLSHNSAQTRTFNPAARDTSGETRLRATVDNAPRGATYKWSANNPAEFEFDPDNALTTTVRGFKPGVGTVAFEVFDRAGNLQAHDTLWAGVPEFVTVQRYMGGTYASPVAGVADHHLFSTVLANYGLTAEENTILTIARGVADHLLRNVNVRVVWRFGPTIDPFPNHLLQRANAGNRIHNTVAIAGYPMGTNRHLIGQTHAPAGTTVHDEAIFIFPGAIDGGAFPETVQVRDAYLAARRTHATAPTAQTGRVLTALTELWREIVGRLIGHTIAHEIGHSLLGDAPGLDAQGHTVLPDIDLMSQTPQSLRSATGIAITAAADLPRGTGFRLGAVNLIDGFSADNQAMIEVMHPVPPAAPFDR